MQLRVINNVFKELSRKYPKPKTELISINHYTFLISIMLSAQATDISVNKATKALFKIVKNPKQMIDLGEKKLKKYIKSIGLFNSKAKNIIALSKIIVDKYNNKVPKEFNQLISLPGIGNKTASVFQNVIYGMPRIAVDTHVFRVVNRIGIVSSKTADLTQKKLEKIVPKKWLITAHHLLILHGRNVCKSQNPHCYKCTIFYNCKYQFKKR